MSRKALRVTLLLPLLLYAAQVSATDDSSRKYRVSYRDQPIASVLQSLTELSGQPINFQTQQLSPHWKVTLDTSATILQIVQHLFADRPYTVTEAGGDIIIQLKPLRPVSIRVTSSLNQPLEDVTIRNVDSGWYGRTDGRGFWRRSVRDDYVRLEVTMVGHAPALVTVYGHQDVVLPANLVEAAPVVIAYGMTPGKRIVGNVIEIKPGFVGGKPFNTINDLLRLVNGMLIRQKTDVLYGAPTMELNGSRTIYPLSANRLVDEPLILIDGLPCPARMGSLSQLASAAGDPTNAGAGLHPLSFLNMEDVESITVLKDGTATAIYGARGANGVIMVNLRKPSSKTPRFKFYTMTGIMEAYRIPQALNTTQYLDLRRSAFRPGTVFNKTNFPELYMDTGLYTNWARELYKNTAITHTTQLSVSGHTRGLYWLGSLNYRRDAYVFPVHNKDEWVRLYNQLRYVSRNGRWELSSFASASIGKNEAPGSDLTPIVFATPHASGQLHGDGLDVYQQPMRLLNSQYRAQSNYYLANLQASFSFGKYFKARIDGGAGWQQLREKAGFPLSSLAPDTNSRGYVDQAGRQIFTWLVEPQLHFNRKGRRLSWQALLGANYQQSQYRSEMRRLPGYTDDVKLQQALVYPTLDTFWTQYKLLSFFGRVNLAIDQRYVVEASLRRDGSSRFARDQRFGNFYSVGAGWLLSETNFWKPSLSAFNLAKLRMSHGVTGNDQVDDYGYMGQYRSTNVPYAYGPYPGWVQTLPGSNRLTWAETHKTEAGLQLEYKQRLGLELGAYWYRSFNQVIRLPLAAQSGFSELAYWNFPAEVDNRGWDVSLYYKTTDSTKRWQYNVRLNYTRPTNRLHSFDSLSVTLLRQELLVGEPLTARKLYHATGVDPTTGLYTVADLDGDGVITPADMQVIRNLEVTGYGSLAVQVQRGRWGLGVIFEGRKQTGYSSAYHTNRLLYPGRLNMQGFSNQPISVLNRWPAPNAAYQMPANSLTDKQEEALENHQNSDAPYTDQSYLCLRHLGIEYTIPGNRLLKGSVDHVRLFAQGSNLFVWSPYKEGNPLLTQPFAQPVTRVFSLGAQISFK